MYSIFEQLLQKNNVTSYRVAKETGIAAATLTDWKNGKSVPKQEKLQKIAKYFDVSIDYLLGLEKDGIDEDDKKRLEALMKEYPDGVIKNLSLLCSEERIERDLTEKSVANEAGIELKDYLAFEKDHENIGIDNIINILLFFKQDINYITGVLTGMLIEVNTEAELDDLLNRLLFDDNWRRKIKIFLKNKLNI